MLFYVTLLVNNFNDLANTNVLGPSSKSIRSKKIPMCSLTDLFDRICVINLPDRTDRYKAIRDELRKFGVPFDSSRSGVPQAELFVATRYHDDGGFPSASVRGCYLSHLTILKEARKQGLRNVLIMEDDLGISRLLPEYLPTIKKELDQKPWGFLYLGHIQELPTLPSPSLIPYDGPLVTAHFYAVNAPIFDRLIAYLEKVLTRSPGDPEGGPMHYDGALSMFRENSPDVLTLIAQPNLGWQRSSRSDIHSRWFDRLPVFRQAAAIGRSVRRHLNDLEPVQARQNDNPVESRPHPENRPENQAAEPDPEHSVGALR